MNVNFGVREYSTTTAFTHTNHLEAEGVLDKAMFRGKCHAAVDGFAY